MQFEFHFWQCDQIELFLIGIDNKISYKMSPNIFLGTFDNITLYNKKLLWLHFGPILGKIGLLYLDIWYDWKGAPYLDGIWQLLPL